MRIAVIALRNAAEARINTSSVIRPSHSNLSPSVIIPVGPALLGGQLPLSLSAAHNQPPQLESRISTSIRQPFSRQAGPACCRTLAPYPLFFSLDRFRAL